MYDICLTVSAWCIIGLLGVLFRFRRTVLDTIKHIINKQRPPGDLPAGAAVFRGTLFFLPYFAASTSTPT